MFQEPLCNKGGSTSNKLDISLLDGFLIEPIVHVMVNDVLHFGRKMLQSRIQLIKVDQSNTLDFLLLIKIISKSKPLLINAKLL